MAMKEIWDGNDLPPIGSEVLIYLASTGRWHKRTVTNYKIRETKLVGKFIIEIHVENENGSPNSRWLNEIRPLDWRNDED